MRSGFTMVEAVVMLGILTAVSAVVLFSFTGFNEGAALNRSARELALSIRKAQNMSLAVTQVPTVNGPKIPPAVGLKLSTLTPSTYFLFADMVRDNKYTASDDAKIGNDTTLERGIRVDSLKDKDGVAHATAYVIFSAPEATTFLGDDNGGSIGDKLDVSLKTPAGQIRTITVRTSGQINVR